MNRRTDRQRPLAHAHEPQVPGAHAPSEPAEADTVVGHRQHERVIVACELQLDAPGAGVLEGVDE